MSQASQEVEDVAALVLLRAGEPTDHAFCIRSWLGSYTHSAMAREIRSYGLDYFALWQGIVERLVRGADLRIACLKDSPEVIVGFACASLAQGKAPPVVHYAYVREQWQGHDIDRTLLAPELGKAVVHYTHEPLGNIRDGKGWRRAPSGWRYRPWWLGVVANKADT